MQQYWENIKEVMHGWSQLSYSLQWPWSRVKGRWAENASGQDQDSSFWHEKALRAFLNWAFFLCTLKCHHISMTDSCLQNPLILAVMTAFILSSRSISTFISVHPVQKHSLSSYIKTRTWKKKRCLNIIPLANVCRIKKMSSVFMWSGSFFVPGFCKTGSLRALKWIAITHHHTVTNREMHMHKNTHWHLSGECKANS